ncbi:MULTISPECIES: hypothetical protein [unclassified Marinovum]
MTTTKSKSTTTASSGTEKLKSNAAALADSARETATDMAQTAAQQAQDTAEHAKDSVAHDVSGVATALRSAAKDMRSGSPQERTIGQLAEGLAEVSDAIRDKDLGTIVRDANDLARRNPALFLGGAALLGFAATRFAKASQPAQTQHAAHDAPMAAGGQAYTGTGPATTGPASTRRTS